MLPERFSVLELIQFRKNKESQTRTLICLCFIAKETKLKFERKMQIIDGCASQCFWAATSTCWRRSSNPELVLIRTEVFGPQWFGSTAAYRYVQARRPTATQSSPGGSPSRAHRRALLLRLIDRLSLLFLSLTCSLNLSANFFFIPRVA